MQVFENSRQTPTFSNKSNSFFSFVNNNFHWLVVFFAHIFTCLPGVIGRGLVHGWFWMEGTLPKNVPATVQLIRPPILKNIFSLAADEMESIRELDVEAVAEHKHMLRFYYGTVDGWCPLEYMHNLKEQVPDANAFACKNQYRHAFVLNFSKPMAEIVGRWIKERP